MNQVNLIGRLTRDPEVRYAGETQMAICRFSIAIDRYSAKAKSTDFIPIKVFGKQAENCEKFLAKGRQVGIEGSIHSDSYEKDGQRREYIEVIANRVEFLQGEKIEKKEQQTRMADFEAIEEDVPF